MNCEKCNKIYFKKIGSGRFCSRSCANSRSWSNSDKKKKSISAKNSNKVKLANKPKKYIDKICPICKNGFRVFLCNSKRIYCSKKCYLNDINLEYRKVAKGGYRQGSGRGKGGWYKGIYCDSSYELAWIIYNIDHNINFERNKKGFKYNYNKKNYMYYPDFYLIETNEYIETKGYKTNKDEAKWKYFPHKIKILYKNDLQEIFNYVKDKYGKNFIELYGVIV